MPDILNEEGHPFYGDYTLKLGTDDIVLGGESCDGYIVSYGDGLYRSLDAVQRLRNLGVNIGLVNKWHVNAVDERVMSIIGRSNFVLVVESLCLNTISQSCSDHIAFSLHAPFHDFICFLLALVCTRSLRL